jgi:CBS domain-containing protein
LPADTDGVSEDQQTTSTTTGTTLKVGSLKSATTGVTAVRHSDLLDRAQALMLRYDYSQLPVLSNARDVLGAISWESIAQKRIHQEDCDLRDCIIPVDVVGIEDDLLPHIPRITESGYVLVRGQDRTICGVVTTTDLSTNFLMLAGPFLLIGEVERKLRQVVSTNFTADEVRAGKDERDADRVVNSVDDLTLGETIRLFHPRERWEQLAWQVDRGVFCSALDASVALRNDIMHFSPDPIEEESLGQVRYLLKWLNLLV